MLQVLNKEVAVSQAQVTSLSNQLNEERGRRGQAEKQLESARHQAMQHCQQLKEQYQQLLAVQKDTHHLSA